MSIQACIMQWNIIPGPATVQLSVTEEQKQGGDLPVTDIEAIKCHQELEVYPQSKGGS